VKDRSRLIVLLTVTGLGLLLVTEYLRGLRRADVGGGGSGATERVSARPSPLLPLGPARRSPVIEDEVEVEDGSIAVEPEMPTDTWHVGGSVVQAPEFLPVVGAEVKVWKLSELGVGGMRPVLTTTGENGRFLLRLNPADVERGQVCSLEVRLSQRRLFSGSVVLDENVLVVVDEQVLLFGEVVGTDPRNLGRIRFQDRSSGEPFFVGESALDAQGRFRCEVALAQRPRALAVTVFLRNGQSVDRTVLVDELLAGAVIEARTNALELRVRDSTGTAIPGATVSLAGHDASGTYHTVARSDSRGVVDIDTTSTWLEYCVGADGYVPELGTQEVGDLSVWVVELSKNDETCLVRGIVQDWEGAPVAGAFVSAYPATGDPELGMAAFHSSLSADDGSFSLHVPPRIRLTLQAYKGPFGLGPSQIVQGSEDGIRLVIPNKGEVRVGIENCGTPIQAIQRPVEYVLAGIREFLEDSGTSATLPVIVGELPEGLYNFYVSSEGLGVYGEGLVEVAAGTRSRAVKHECRTWLAS